MNYRQAEAADAGDVAELATIAGGGLFEYCLGGASTNETAQAVALLISALEDGFSMSNAIVVTEEDASGKEQVAAAMIAYPAAEFAGAETFTTFVQPELLEPLKGLLEPLNPQTLYIHSLAVRPAFEGRGIHASLIELAEDTALGLGLSEVSVHVWSDHHEAIAIYNQHGFITQKLVPTDAGEQIGHSGGMLLLAKTLEQ
ncbi:MAG: GNAT family N-acetyltransferase [Pseudomonadota bacterium]